MTTKLVAKERRFERKLKEDAGKPIQIDKKTIRKSIFLAFVVVIALLVFTIDFKGLFIKNSLNWESTAGYINSYEPVEGLSQSRTGNRMVVRGYWINYSYIYNSNQYNKKDYIQNSKITNFIQNKEKLSKIEIYVSKKNPHKSYLNTNINSKFYKIK